MASAPLSIAVVGGGIAGLYSAHRLAGHGHRVTIFAPHRRTH
jgi:2-polyprenyl-6-methoxyphenol hydroxylase-like FAD-dependent oxidoreductase